MIKTLQLPSNKVGRDFVIGDLHGCRDLLDRLLEYVKFDSGADRLFSVGDLADRGLHSMQSLSLLNESWFSPVLGNHESALLNYVGQHRGNEQIGNAAFLFQSDFGRDGGEWVLDELVDCEPTPELQRALDAIANLPHVISVGEGERRFNVVHGELYCSLNGSRIYQDKDIDTEFLGEDHDDLLRRMTTGRHLLANSLLFDGMREGLSLTYSGHSIVNKPRLCASHLGIDTGAFLSLRSSRGRRGDNYLTMIQVNSVKGFRAAYMPEAPNGIHVDTLSLEHVLSEGYAS